MVLNVVRDGKYLSIECFLNGEVIEYLRKELNDKSFRFKVVADNHTQKVISAQLDDVDFTFSASGSTNLRISYAIKDKAKMKEVISVIMKWNKFSKTEKKFTCKFNSGDTQTIIFENGYNSPDSYSFHFRELNPVIQEF